MTGQIAGMMKQITDYQKNVNTGKSINEVAGNIGAGNPFESLVQIQEIIDSAGDNKMLAAKRTKSISVQLIEKRANFNLK